MNAQDMERVAMDATGRERMLAAAALENIANAAVAAIRAANFGRGGDLTKANKTLADAIAFWKAMELSAYEGDER